MSSVFGGGFEELAGPGVQGPGAGQGEHSFQPLKPRPEAEGDTAQLHLSALVRIERELRRMRMGQDDRGRQFAQEDGGQASAGGLLVQRFEGPKSGNDWYVERVTLSASGASAAGTMGLYRTGQVDTTTGLPPEAMLVDFLGALTGNAPSRGRLDGTGVPYFVYGGMGFTVVIAGVVAASSLFISLQGREVLAGADPDLRPQVN